MLLFNSFSLVEVPLSDEMIKHYNCSDLDFVNKREEINVLRSLIVHPRVDTEKKNQIVEELNWQSHLLSEYGVWLKKSYQSQDPLQF